MSALPPGAISEEEWQSVQSGNCRSEPGPSLKNVVEQSSVLEKLADGEIPAPEQVEIPLVDVEPSIITKLDSFPSEVLSGV